MTHCTRQTGEPVAWKTRLVDKVDGFKSSWSITTLPPPGPDNGRVIARETIPLIPASDLATITRERDEAVRLLREALPYIEGGASCNIGTEDHRENVELLNAVEAFLASLPATGGET